MRRQWPPTESRCEEPIKTRHEQGNFGRKRSGTPFDSNPCHHEYRAERQWTRLWPNGIPAILVSTSSFNSRLALEDNLRNLGFFGLGIFFDFVVVPSSTS